MIDLEPIKFLVALIYKYIPGGCDDVLYVEVYVGGEHPGVCHVKLQCGV